MIIPIYVIARRRQPDAPKLCKDCKHFGAKDETCKSPRNGSIDRVTGNRKPAFIFCETHRYGEGWLMARLIGVCGEGARWFEPKEPK